MTSLVASVDWAFVFAVWALSRGLILSTMLLVYHHAKTHHPGAPGWLSPLANWDGLWYERIAAHGYSLVPDAGGHLPVAFFPLYPLFIALLERCGLEPTLAGVAISNIAFFLTLAIAYAWMKQRFDISAARWSSIVMALLPHAVFTGVVYTEALFMLLALCAIVLFDSGLYPYAAICGALASATRPVGIALAPAMLVAWIVQRRPPAAAIAAVGSTAGLLVYVAFQYVHFGDALAFVHAQAAWEDKSEAAATWVATLAHPLKFKAIVKIVMVVGAAILFYWARRSFPPIFMAFATSALVLITFSGDVTSADRFVYGIPVFAMGLGLLFSRHRYWGYGSMIVSFGLLCFFSARFALRLWVA